MTLAALAQLKIAVSIAPQSYFVHQIAKDLAAVYVMVPNGKNPEQYEPLISQMKNLKDCAFYLGIGLDFERRWKARFMDSAQGMEFIAPNLINTSQDYFKHDHHIWLSVRFAARYAEQIANLLMAKDPQNKAKYQQNLKEFLQKISDLDGRIKEIFASPMAKKTFLVFHPAFEFLAQEYGLTQLAIEVENKEVKIKHLQEISRQILQNHLKVIYKTPEFSTQQVILLAQEYGLKISDLDPFAYDWAQNLYEIALKIANER